MGNLYEEIQIEARVLGDLAMNHIIPTATKYQTSLIDNVYKMKDLFPADKASILRPATWKLLKTSPIAPTSSKRRSTKWWKPQGRQQDRKRTREAITYHDKIVPMLEAIRYHIDKLELVVDDQIWTLPKYRELLFIR